MNTKPTSKLDEKGSLSTTTPRNTATAGFMYATTVAPAAPASATRANSSLNASAVQKMARAITAIVALSEMLTGQCEGTTGKYMIEATIRDATTTAVASVSESFFETMIGPIT